ncbi:MAG: RDD family protein, partial [Bacilli bacterium]|nr:RDD family protein [Bacilli bacterium]
EGVHRMNQPFQQSEIVNESLSGPKVEIVYQRPKFFRRVMANFMDALLLIFLSVSCFLGFRAIIIHTPDYQAKTEELLSIRLDSKMYAYDDNGILQDVVTSINKDAANSAYSRARKAKLAIQGFFDYASEKATPENYSLMADDYRSFRLSPDMAYSSSPLFVLDGEEVVENPELVGGATILDNIWNIYYQQAYAPFIDGHLQGYLVTRIPRTYELNQYVALILIFGEILPGYAFAGLLVYLLPIFIFRRGRMTFGKAAYRIGLLDQRILSPSVPRSLARFAIFYFGELLLSLVTLGAPFIISFSMMAFSKKQRGFPDYLLGLQEVDCTSSKIYFSVAEIDLDAVTGRKKPVDFKPDSFE